MPNEYQRADHERRIHRLEEDNKKIFSSLDDIKKGQHSQDLVNQKMNFTLDSINRERELNKKKDEESRKDFKQVKYLLLGTVATIGSSLLLAFLRSLLGI
ncbi:DUF2951 domain-containing protein [Staphylococcus simulans]|uniref:DUF2951 family protein n=1 Tax=Staphylococcus simulans TaxID=1286 RepID=UPI000D0A7231|nr:DUF2951 family protein [Staphylococcus simulans]AVO02297.1 hypothetical protein BI282_07740 [Staphylococcus simulans]AVO05243.1 hypothetical protein BI283_07705 [Staphylococcus simulans]AWG18846.1 hypothetical protein A9958_07750 [Staphylococcus simulans]AWI01793.1 hypothetical protein A7X73_07635 [Staphylococcus simulans]PTI97324.1 DUF2951 domain-containing protein [Staphylococcus simulans]